MNESSIWKRLWKWMKGLFKQKNHKLVVNTKCKDTCCCHSSCLLVYNEKNESTDNSGSDIEVSPTGIIKVK